MDDDDDVNVRRELIHIKDELTPILARLDRLLKHLGHHETVDLVMLGCNMDKKIDLIKTIRELTGLGLKECKDLVEKPLPVTLVRDFREPSNNTVATWALSHLRQIATIEVRRA